MTRITVLGGTGYSGLETVREAAGRGHEVTSVSRSAPEDRIDGVRYATGSVLDAAVLDDAFKGAEVVYDALSPRGELEGRLEHVVEDLIRRADTGGVRLGVLGGASSLLVSPDGPRLLDAGDPPPPEVLPEILTGIATLDLVRGAPDSLDWFYVSPAQKFGAWAPGERTGRYRVSDDVLLVDGNGDSALSAADLAVAVLDEIERPQHRRRRFHVAY